MGLREPLVVAGASAIAGGALTNVLPEPAMGSLEDVTGEDRVVTRPGAGDPPRGRRRGRGDPRGRLNPGPRGCSCPCGPDGAGEVQAPATPRASVGRRALPQAPGRPSPHRPLDPAPHHAGPGRVPGFSD